jgi:hypothetical protein
MNSLSNFLVEQILLEDKSPIKDVVVVYVGRFQPMHKGHYAVYEHLTKKFGKNNVFVGTSDKVEKDRSPFSFKEKQEIMYTMFGIPKNRIVNVKNPYAPTEVLKKYNEKTTAFVTVVGEKDKSRLGGKYFQKWDGEPTEGYDVRGYVYVAPSFGGGISGTETRNGLSLGSDEQKKDFFKNRVYGKYNEKIFRMITDKLNESFVIRKETIEEWLIKEHNHINGTLGFSDTGDMEVDDGPNSFLPNFEVFNKINVERAVRIGYDVLQKITMDVIEDYPIYPDGPVDAVSFYPAGVIGKLTTTNQVDYYNNDAYDEWYKHATRVAGQAGYQLVQTELEKIHGKEVEDQSEKDAINLKKYIEENINIPVKVGDTILTGRFKNKKVVVKNIGKDDHGMPTINGKKVVNFRLVKEGFIAELVGSTVDCQKCDHTWEIRPEDKTPYLCHLCGYDNQKMEFDYDEWNKWKEKEEINEVSSNGGYRADAGEPDPVFVTNGNIRKINSNKGRPEYWFENGGYTQLHFPKGDFPFGKGKGKDTESQQRVVKYKVKNVVKSTLPPPKSNDVNVEKIYETIKKVNGKYVVYPKGGGDRLGTHDTLSAAKKQLAAIEISKHKHESLFGGDGGMKPYEKLLMGGLVKFMQNTLGFSGKVVVKKKSSNSLFGDLSLSDAAMRGKITLHYNPNSSYEIMLKSLIHELIHAKQVAKGELKPSSDYKSLVWKGNPFISVKDYNNFQRKDINQYKKLPWEKEAYAGMDKYYRMFLNSKEFKELVGKDPNLDYILSNLNEVGIGTGQSGLRMGYPDKDQLKKRMKDVENQRKQTDSNKEFQYEPINEGQLEDLGITDFKSLFQKMPSDLQKRVYNLKNIEQRKDTHPEGNVLKHTITVVNRSLKDDDIDIAIAAMFHDIGKDETMGIHPTKGHITHFGHEKVSANLVSKYKNWIQSVGANPANVLYIVKNHMRYKELSNMRPKKQEKLKSFRAFDKLDKFSKHDRGGLGEGIDYVVCRECGEKMKQVQYRHLQYKHNMTLEEYRKKHPSAQLVCETAKSIGDKNPMKNTEVRKKHQKSVSSIEYKQMMSERMTGVNKGNKRPDLEKLNKDPNFRRKISEGVKRSYQNNPSLLENRTNSGKKYGFGNQKTKEKIAKIKGHVSPQDKDPFLFYTELVRNKTNENYQKHFDKIENAKKRSRDFHLDHKYSIKEGFDNNIPVEVIAHYKNLRILDGRLNESKGSKSSIKLNELIVDIQNSNDPLDNRILLLCGGAYGHMAHPFDTEINLTFGDLKDIANRALDGTLELTTEKTDGQALAISWRDDRGLIAARNKGHLKNRGESALDINGVSAKFQGRGGLSDAYNFAMKDLTKAIKTLSPKQREKIFQNGSSFMNLEVIYPTSVNVIPYGQPLLIFHGTMQYDENGIAVGENKEAARILAGMIKQVNQDVQDNYTIQGPPFIQLPKSQTLSSKKGKYLGQIQKLQSEFGLKDTDGVAEYHQAWWSNWVDKNSPVTLDNKTKMGLVKRWAFGDKSFSLNKNNIPDQKLLEWAQKHEKDNHQKISKDNLMKFENIFLGLGAEVLEFTSSALTVNPDKAIRDMKQRLDQTAKDVRKSGDPKKIAKLKLELERLNSIGGPSKIVPIEGIVFQYKGKTMKLTGSFASLNQILGIFYG